MIPRDTHDGAFYRAVLALHQDLFSLAQQVGCIITEQYMRPLKVYIFKTRVFVNFPSATALGVFFGLYSIVPKN